MLTTKITTKPRPSYPALPLERCQRRPSHPGAILREIFLPAAHLSQGDLAKRLGVPRHAISQIVNEQRPITPDLANRLGRFFGNGAALWLRLQQQLDVWDISNADESQYGQIEPLEVEEGELIAA